MLGAARLTLGGAYGGQMLLLPGEGNHLLDITVTQIMADFGVCGVVQGRSGSVESDVDDGEGGFYQIGAGGAGLAYFNAFFPTVGQTIRMFVGGQNTDSFIQVVSTSTDLARVASGVGSSGGFVRVGTGFTGGNGGLAYGAAANGGGAAGYTSAGGGAAVFSGFQLGRGGGGITPYGGGAGAAAAASADINGLALGGGAAVASGVSGGRTAGFARLLWGPGRAFPNTNTGDL